MALISRFPFFAVLVIACIISATGCSHQAAPKRYELEGHVVSVDAATRELTISHQAIPGVMEAMTMPYLVSPSDQWVFSAIATGDHIHATLVLGKDAELQDITFSKGNDGASQSRLPLPGDAVPDFTLVNQSGAAIHLAQFRSKPLLVTFIYTRCPFPDYCVRMSHNFAEVMQALQKNPQAFAAAQLLSISIDPEHDKPADLRSYGERYVGQVDPRFQHWQFASGSREQVRKAADFFGLTYNSKDGQIVHNLSTVLIDADGKVRKVYSGNDWKPAEVAADIITAAGA